MCELAKLECECGFDTAEALHKRKHIDLDLFKPQRDKKCQCDDDGEFLKDEEGELIEVPWDEDDNYIHQQLLKDHVARIRIYNLNKQKVFALIWNQCDEGLKTKIESSKEWKETVEPSKDPLKLLDLIQTGTHTFYSVKYPYETVADTARAFWTFKRKEGEDLNAYFERFKSLAEAYTSIVGETVLSPILKTNPQYKAKTTVEGQVEYIEDNKDDAWKEMEATVLRRGDTHPTTQKLNEDLANEFTKGTDNYPHTPTDAIAMMSAYSNKVNGTRKNTSEKSFLQSKGNGKGNNNNNNNNSNNNNSGKNNNKKKEKQEPHCTRCGNTWSSQSPHWSKWCEAPNSVAQAWRESQQQQQQHVQQQQQVQTGQSHVQSGCTFQEIIPTESTNRFINRSHDVTQ
jgi:hypothetical protein